MPLSIFCRFHLFTRRFSEGAETVVRSFVLRGGGWGGGSTRQSFGHEGASQHLQAYRPM